MTLYPDKLKSLKHDTRSSRRVSGLPMELRKFFLEAKEFATSMDGGSILVHTNYTEVGERFSLVLYIPKREEESGSPELL